MINMMYLVLTALLALQISKDILQALTKLDTSLEQAANTVNQKNAETYAAFDNAMADNAAKVKPFRDKALEVKEEADNLNSYIENIKTELVTMTGGLDENGIPANLKNREKVANYLLNQGKATELKGEIEQFRATMLEAAGDDAALKQNIQALFDTDKQEVPGNTAAQDWEKANFEHYPLAAVLPFLTDIQARVRNTEADIISELQSNIGKQDVNFTGVKAMVDATSSYVIQGDYYEADVFLAAYDDTQEPEIIIDGKRLPEDQITNGVGKVRFKATSIGEQKWGGKIIIKQIGKDPIEETFTSSYTVSVPTAVISPTKMNVLYRGVVNPLEIGVPGVDPSQVRVSGAGVSGSGGNYSANVTNIQGKEITISVSVQDEDGTRQVGSKLFRIKGLPPAVGSVYRKSEGLMSAGLLKNATIEANYEDFPFDLPLTVTSFEVAIPGFPPEQVRGNRMTGDVKTRIERMRPGQTISIRDIKASGPGGLRVTRVGNISIDVN